MSDNTIYMEYRKVMEKADELDELARLMRQNTSRNADAVKSDIISSWSSESGRICLERSDLLAIRIGLHASELEYCAAILRTAAISHYGVEEFAHWLFG